MILAWQLGGLTEGYYIQKAHCQLTRYRITSAQNGHTPSFSHSIKAWNFTKRDAAEAHTHGCLLATTPSYH